MRILKSLRAPCSFVALAAVIGAGGTLLPEASSSTPVEEQGTPQGEPLSVEHAGGGSAVTGQPDPQARRPLAQERPQREARHTGVDGVFRGLGAWVDQFDYRVLDPRTVVPLLKANGVRTVYLQTGYSSYAAQVDPRVGPWLVEASRAGIATVGWYLPNYYNVRRDVIRTVAIKNYEYQGHRFDGLGIDIENRRGVRSRTQWNHRVGEHARFVRNNVGADYPVAAITPTPLQMRVAPDFWAGFPWRSLARTSNAFLLMSYWSDRSGCPRIRHHCAYEFTAQNVQLTRHLAGSPTTIVHIIGGIGDSITGAEVWDFTRAAIEARANGASLYDVETTHPNWWRALRELRNLQ